MFGSTTALGHYCPIGMVITNKEDEKAQDFLFEFIKENANICMADGAKATSKSLEKILPETIRLMCWWHKNKNKKHSLHLFIQQIQESTRRLCLISKIFNYKEFFTTKPLNEKKRKHITIIQENIGIYRGKTISVTAMPNIPYEKSEAEWRVEVSRKHRQRTEMDWETFDEFVETSKQVVSNN